MIALEFNQYLHTLNSHQCLYPSSPGGSLIPFQRITPKSYPNANFQILAAYSWFLNLRRSFNTRSNGLLPQRENASEAQTSMEVLKTQHYISVSNHPITQPQLLHSTLELLSG